MAPHRELIFYRTAQHTDGRHTQDRRIFTLDLIAKRPRSDGTEEFTTQHGARKLNPAKTTCSIRPFT